MSNPDFYLASSEGYGMKEPRRCFTIRRLRGIYRDDYLLVRIEPPVIGQNFGLGGRDIDHVILATRHIGESLFPSGHFWGWFGKLFTAFIGTFFSGSDWICFSSLNNGGGFIC